MAMKDGIKNYRDMMKRMEGMGEEKIPARENMGMDSMMRPDNIESIIKGDPNLEKMKIQPLSEQMMLRQIQEGKGSMSDAELDAMQKMAGMGREMALKGTMTNMGMGSISDNEMKMLEDMMGDSLTDEVKLALESLLRMGMSMSDSIEALQATDGIADTIDTSNTMTEGALGSLPERDTPTEMRPESFGADRTQSMEMQKEAMGT